MRLAGLSDPLVGAAQQWAERVAEAGWQKQEGALKFGITLGSPLCFWLPLGYQALGQAKCDGVSWHQWNAISSGTGPKGSTRQCSGEHSNALHVLPYLLD